MVGYSTVKRLMGKQSSQEEAVKSIIKKEGRGIFAIDNINIALKEKHIRLNGKKGFFNHILFFKKKKKKKTNTINSFSLCRRDVECNNQSFCQFC